MTRTRTLLAFLLAALALMAVLPGCRHPAAQKAPDFSVTDLDGKVHTLESFKDKVLIVDFWATWCAPCIEETPGLVEFQRRHEARGVQLLGLSLDDGPGPVRRFRERFKVNYPLALADRKVTKAFGNVLGLPVLFVIARDGTLVARHEGVVDLDQLEKEIEKLM